MSAKRPNYRQSALFVHLFTFISFGLSIFDFLTKTGKGVYLNVSLKLDLNMKSFKKLKLKLQMVLDKLKLNQTRALRDVEMK